MERKKLNDSFIEIENHFQLNLSRASLESRSVGTVLRRRINDPISKSVSSDSSRENYLVEEYRMSMPLRDALPVLKDTVRAA